MVKIKNKMIKTRKGEYEYPVVNSVPKGWKKVNGTLTQPNGYIWISNGKSLFGGERQHAIVKESTYERQAKGGSVG